MLKQGAATRNTVAHPAKTIPLRSSSLAAAVTSSKPTYGSQPAAGASSKLAAAAEPSPSPASSSKQILPRFADENAQRRVSAPGPHPTLGSRIQPAPLPSSASGKSRQIMSLTNWRARSDTVATTSSALVRSAPKAAPLSVAKVVSPSTAVAALPRQEAEAERVSKEMSQYRKEHGLTEESYFTSMVKVQAERMGVARPKPIINTSVPPSESTAVYLKGLPADTTYYSLLQNIHCGQIWHTYIDPANPPKQPTCAAKVAFLTRAQAEAFMSDIAEGRYSVRGQRVANAIWDRRAEMERADLKESRCIQIQGPANMMEWAWFEKEFTAKMDLKITEFFEVDSKDPTSKIFQINFAGIFAQSRAVVKSIEKDFGDIYSFRYVADPCNDGAY